MRGLTSLPASCQFNWGLWDCESVLKTEVWKKWRKIAFISNLIFWLKISMQLIFLSSFIRAMRKRKGIAVFGESHEPYNVNLWTTCMDILAINETSHTQRTKDTYNYATSHTPFAHGVANCEKGRRRLHGDDFIETYISKQYHSFSPSSNQFEPVYTWKLIDCVCTRNKIQWLWKHTCLY